MEGRAHHAREREEEAGLLLRLQLQHAGARQVARHRGVHALVVVAQRREGGQQRGRLPRGEGGDEVQRARRDRLQQRPRLLALVLRRRQRAGQADQPARVQILCGT